MMLWTRMFNHNVISAIFHSFSKRTWHFLSAVRITLEKDVYKSLLLLLFIYLSITIVFWKHWVEYIANDQKACHFRIVSFEFILLKNILILQTLKIRQFLLSWGLFFLLFYYLIHTFFFLVPIFIEKRKMKPKVIQWFIQTVILILVVVYHLL